MNRSSMVAAVAAMFLGVGAPTAAQAQKSLLVVNQCHLPISIVVRMRELNNIWTTRGWGNVQPNTQRRFRLRTTNSFIYYYAMSKPRRFIWHGRGRPKARMNWIVTRSFVHTSGPMDDPDARRVWFRAYELRTDTNSHRIRLTCNSG